MEYRENWTGERIETDILNETAIEHLHRYALAKELVHNKKVLDIACGEGYGTALLAMSAAAVTGIDIDPGTIEKAKQKYTSNKLRFLQGDILTIPCPDNSFDIVVSFETLEHVADHQKIITELKRVLAPGGLLILSTPDRAYHADAHETRNPFHVQELYQQEFEALVREHFDHHLFLNQQSAYYSVILPAGEATPLRIFEGDYKQINETRSLKPFFHIVIASDKPIPNMAASLFNSSWSFSQQIQKKLGELKQTRTYKTGRLVLAPLRFLRNIFKK